MRKTMIIVHASDTYADMDIGVDEIRRWHVDERKWQDVGYNLVIKRDGTSEKGRDLDSDGDVFEEQGAHAYGYNKTSIGICLIGGRGEDGKPEANFTLAQYTRLKYDVDFLLLRYPSITRVVGHHELNASKACPCFHVPSLLSLTLP